MRGVKEGEYQEKCAIEGIYEGLMIILLAWEWKMI